MGVPGRESAGCGKAIIRFTHLVLSTISLYGSLLILRCAPGAGIGEEEEEAEAAAAAKEEEGLAEPSQ